MANINLILLIILNTGYQSLRQRKTLNFQTESVVIVDELRTKFLLFKWHVEKILKSRRNVNLGFLVLCLMLHGVIWKKMELFWSCIINVWLMNVIVRSKLLSRHKNVCLRVNQIKVSKKRFKSTEKAWKNFLKLALDIGCFYIGMAVAAKTKNLETDKATGNNSKPISGGKNLSFTDLYGNGLRLKVMWI